MSDLPSARGLHIRSRRMRSAVAGARSRISWVRFIHALYALGLCVCAPLSAVAQEPAPESAAADSGEAAAPAEQPAPESAAAEPAADGATAAPPQTPLASAAAVGPAPAQARAEVTEPEQPEASEPVLSLSAQVGVGYLSGGHGGLFAANRSPLALDVQVLAVREPRYLIGGALRIELEGAKAVAGIFRFQLRHPLGPIELRPGIGVPFYIAPRTMLGPEVGVWGRLSFSRDLALLAALSASAFVMGDDVPKGSTVIMLQVFIGAELFI